MRAVMYACIKPIKGKDMFKRGLIALSTLVFALSLVGCGEREQAKEDSEEAVSSAPATSTEAPKATEEKKPEAAAPAAEAPAAPAPAPEAKPEEAKPADSAAPAAPATEKAN